MVEEGIWRKWFDCARRLKCMVAVFASLCKRFDDISLSESIFQETVPFFLPETFVKCWCGCFNIGVFNNIFQLLKPLPEYFSNPALLILPETDSYQILNQCFERF